MDAMMRAAERPATSPAPAAEPAPRLGVRLEAWHAVASWTWNAGDDVCGICHTDFDGCPPEAKFPDDAPVAWGVCSHAFHLPCIHKWLQPRAPHEQKCPICRQAWEYKGEAPVAAPAPPAAG